MHLNPKVKQPVTHYLSDIENVHLIDPLGYPEFLWLMSKAFLILTDSGGIQEEAPSLNIPVLVMRDTTEREEAILAGTAKLVGTRMEEIVKETALLLDSSTEYASMSSIENPFGDGEASKEILKILRD